MSAATTSRQVLLSLSLLCFLSLFSLIKSDELQLLLNVKTALQKSNADVFNSWRADNSVSNFTGITCNSDGSVKEIELSGKQLSGVLPLDSICQLSSLEKLSFGRNFLFGSLTDDLNNCVRLHYLDLGNNLFTGSVPDISSLSQLQYLYLNLSGFSGVFPWKSLRNMTNLIALSVGDNPFDRTPFPGEIQELYKLNWLYLTNCSMEGSIPGAIGNLTELINLELSDNFLTGIIPPQITKLQKLWQLELYNNSLTGKFPVGFGNLTNLENFDASMNSLEGDLSELRFLTKLLSLQLFENQFSGEVPAELGEFKQLVNLSIYTNKLSGSLPQKLGSWAEFIFIDASENFFTGPIPPDMCKKGTMIALLLLQNKFTGAIPANYANCPSLKRFRVSNNSLSGTVPAGIWGLPNLNIIDIALNQFEGPISSNFTLPNLQYFFSSSCNLSEFPNFLSICNSSSLEILDLSNNSLSGIIPPCLGNFSNQLSVLDLSMNSFLGTIPRTFGKGNMLRNIDLNGNRLEGLVPRSLINCRHLEVLDLGNNMLNDTFPYWLETLLELQVFVLQSNKFHGSITSSEAKHPFPKLRILDLSNNDFRGPLPKRYFKNLKAMMNVKENETEPNYMGEQHYYHDSVILTIKGSQIELVKILTTLVTIDLSNNSFQGEIPKSIGKLSSIRGLNFSHNNLTGHIPIVLENLGVLESLDLSSNNLIGEIPVQLTSLTFLEILNLSQNHLVGRIPQGNQFNTFRNDSYFGNKGLCGPPLLKKCSDDEAPPPPPLMVVQEKDDLVFTSGFGWKAVLMGYGCGVLFGLVMGYLMFLTGKPKWLVRIIEEEILEIVKRMNKNARRRGRRRN